LGPDSISGDRPGLEVFQLELQDGPPISRRIQIAVHDMKQLTALPHNHHAFANLAVFNRSHKYLRPQKDAAMAPNANANRKVSKNA